MSPGAREACIALALCAEPADARVGRLVARWGPVQTVERLRADRSGTDDAVAARLRALVDDPDERAATIGARIVTRHDREWPTQLDDLAAAAPHALWVVGAADLRLLALRSVAIVGARACTPYGEELARSWAADLSGQGWCVVSGGAFGIDAAAHRGALAASAPTVCVLAGGVDMPYPRAHEALIARIADEGLVLSESPPGESVRRQRFLSRNRVIAALTRATVVVEAAERSGTIATARAADAMNRPVLAVPGPVTSPASAGCHRMIRDREAILVGSTADVVEVLEPSALVPSGPPVALRSRDRLGGAERRALDALPVRRAMSLEALALAAGLTPAQARAAIGILEADDWVVQAPDGWALRPASRSR